MPEAHKPSAAKAAKEQDEAAVAAVAKKLQPEPEKKAPEKAPEREQADERVKRATESEKLEKRPGLSSDPFQEDYSVEAELRGQWPDIVLGDE